MSDLTDEEKMGLFAHAVDVNGAKALVQSACVNADGQLVSARFAGDEEVWPVGAWFNFQKIKMKNPAKKAALYAMLTQDGSNEIVKANLDKFLAASAASAAF